MMILILTGSCAGTHSLMGDHQLAFHEFRTRALSQEKEAVQKSTVSSHVEAAILLFNRSPGSSEGCKRSRFFGESCQGGSRIPDGCP